MGIKRKAALPDANFFVWVQKNKPELFGKMDEAWKSYLDWEHSAPAAQVPGPAPAPESPARQIADMKKNLTPWEMKQIFPSEKVSASDDKNGINRKAAATTILTPSITALETEIKGMRPDNPGYDDKLRQLADMKAAAAKMPEKPAPPQTTEEAQTLNPSNAPAAKPAVVPGGAPAPSGSFIGASMFNSPENIKRIAELLSLADKGESIDNILIEIQRESGLAPDAFWTEIFSVIRTAEKKSCSKCEDCEGCSCPCHVAYDKGLSEGMSGESAHERGVEDGKLVTAAENPFVKNEDKDEDEEGEKEEDSEDKDEKKEKKEKNKKSESESDEDEGEGEKKPEKKEMKKDKASKKKSKKDKPTSPESEEKDIESAEKILDMIDELMASESEEGETHGGDLLEAKRIMEEFIAEEKGEDHSEEEEMAMIEKTGPDVPPALEGMALPLPKPSHEDAMGMKVIDVAPQALGLAAALGAKDLSTLTVGSMLKRLAMIDSDEARSASDDLLFIVAAKTTPEAQEEVSKKMEKLHKEETHKPKEERMSKEQQVAISLEHAREKGYKIPEKKAAQDEKSSHEEKSMDSGSSDSDKKSEDHDKKCPHCGLKDCKCEPHNSKSSFQLNDRVWRKADFESGFETVGDEAGRIVDFGNGKAIVDWGHEDGIPTEENPSDLVLAHVSAGEVSMFSLSKNSTELDVKAVSVNAGPMANIEHVENVLRETSLFEILSKQANDDKKEDEQIKHVASGKSGKITQRLAGGQLRVTIEGNELIVWPYEVE